MDSPAQLVVSPTDDSMGQEDLEVLDETWDSQDDTPADRPQLGPTALEEAVEGDTATPRCALKVGVACYWPAVASWILYGSAQGL